MSSAFHVARAWASTCGNLPLAWLDALLSPHVDLRALPRLHHQELSKGVAGRGLQLDVPALHALPALARVARGAATVAVARPRGVSHHDDGGGVPVRARAWSARDPCRSRRRLWQAAGERLARLARPRRRWAAGGLRHPHVGWLHIGA